MSQLSTTTKTYKTFVCHICLSVHHFNFFVDYFRKIRICRYFKTHVLKVKWSNQGCLTGSLRHLQMKMSFTWFFFREFKTSIHSDPIVWTTFILMLNILAYNKENWENAKKTKEIKEAHNMQIRLVVNKTYITYIVKV